MDDPYATSSRRRVLSAVAGTGTAALAGCTSVLPSRLSTHTDTASVTVGSDTGGLADDERERYVGRMAERYGSGAADEIIPDASAVDLQPGLEPTDLVWDCEQSLSVTDSSGTTLAGSDNYAAVYETNETASEDEYAVYWLWSCARPRETGELRTLWSHVDVTDGGDVLMYDPGGDITDNGTIGPHPEKTGQDTDEFAVRWQGEHTGTQTVTGCFSERRDDGERGFEWTVHLAGKER